jgi:hypothetical protein
MAPAQRPEHHPLGRRPYVADRGDQCQHRERRQRSSRAARCGDRDEDGVRADDLDPPNEIDLPMMP